MTSGRQTTEPIRFTDRAKARINSHRRDSESVCGTIGRAFDSLEREQAMPDAVSDRLRDGYEPTPAAGNAENPNNITPELKARIDRHNRADETLSETVTRAFDSLEREADLPDVVAEVCEHRLAGAEPAVKPDGGRDE